MTTIELIKILSALPADAKISLKLIEAPRGYGYSETLGYQATSESIGVETATNYLGQTSVTITNTDR